MDARNHIHVRQVAHPRCNGARPGVWLSPDPSPQGAGRGTRRIQCARRGNVLENEHLRVTFHPSGTIGILDKNTGKEMFQGGATGARAVILDDPHDTWANVNAFDRDIAAFENAKIRVLENGPLRAVVRVRATYGDSTLTTESPALRRERRYRSPGCAGLARKEKDAEVLFSGRRQWTASDL